jgi:hypothetical protein
MTDLSPGGLHRRHTLLSTAALGAVAALGLSGCSGRDAAPESSFVLLDGSRATTADLKGKVTLVNSGPPPA